MMAKIKHLAVIAGVVLAVLFVFKMVVPEKVKAYFRI